MQSSRKQRDKSNLMTSIQNGDPASTIRKCIADGNYSREQIRQAYMTANLKNISSGDYQDVVDYLVRILENNSR